MKLSASSWHARLYDLTFTSVRPTNLCPYFWKLLLACILFPFLGVWFLPTFIIGRIKKENAVDDGMLSADFAIALVVNSALFAATCMIGMWFFPLKGEWNWLQQTGAFLWYLTIVVAGIWGFKAWKDKRKERKWRRERGDEPIEGRPSILVEFIKAKYSKYCPKIEWKETAE